MKGLDRYLTRDPRELTPSEQRKLTIEEVAKRIASIANEIEECKYELQDEGINADDVAQLEDVARSVAKLLEPGK